MTTMWEHLANIKEPVGITRLDRWEWEEGVEPGRMFYIGNSDSDASPCIYGMQMYGGTISTDGLRIAANGVRGEDIDVDIPTARRIAEMLAVVDCFESANSDLYP